MKRGCLAGDAGVIHAGIDSAEASYRLFCSSFRGSRRYVDITEQLWVRLSRLGGNDGVGTISSGSERYVKSNAPAGTGDEQGLAFKRALLFHGLGFGKPRKGGACLASKASMAARGSGEAKAAAWLLASRVNMDC